mgnify:CR=1 FL=1
MFTFDYLTILKSNLFILLSAAMPQHDPKIEGVEKNYYEGDFLFGNCTSDFSYPPPILAWYINEQKADADLLQPFQESTVEAYGFKLHQRSLEIRFRIDKRINPFVSNDGKVHMRCVAQIKHMPNFVRESNHIFYVSSLGLDAELRNQKLINWKNSGEALLLLNSFGFDVPPCLSFPFCSLTYSTSAFTIVVVFI